MWEQFREALNRAGSRVILGVADFLPGVLAMVVVLLCASIAAWVAGVVLRRWLTRLHFNEHMARWGFPELSEGHPPRSATILVSRLVSWTIVVLGFLIGLTALDATLTSALTQRAFAYLPDFLAAIVILMIGGFISRFLARGALISAVNMKLQSARLISLGVKWLILVLTGAMAMEHLRLGGDIVKMAFGIAFGGIVLALALAVGLGSKELVSRSLERQEEKEQEDEKDATRPLSHL